MAFFPANATYPSMLGELYSAAFTAPAFNWQCSPAITELETIVMDWMAEILHLSDAFLSKGKGGGVIQGSASEAIVTVMIAARDRYVKNACQGLEGEARTSKMNYIWSRMVALGSDQSHSSTAKGAKILGVKYKEIPAKIENQLAVTGADFDAILEECRREGLEPFYVTACLGTTATCACDHFADIVAVNHDPRRSHFASNPPWIHVDAAYAGAALCCEEYAYLAKECALVDSFDMNMHKWLLTNFDCSCLFIRDRTDLTAALSITPSYLNNMHTDSGLVTDYRDWQIPLGRRFRALKVWFVLRTYGVNGLKAHVRRHIEMGETFAGWVEERGDLFEMPAPAAFALTTLTLKAGNEKTKQVYERINAAGEIFLTSSVVKGIYLIRVVLANERGEVRHLKKAFDIIVRTTEEVLGRKFSHKGINGFK